MKFFRFLSPRNDVNWDVRNPNSGWRSWGTIPTSSGKAVSEDSALTFGPVMAATRVICEGMAILPLLTLEQKDERTSRKATDHSLWSVLHDIPNPEQDKMCFFDMQVAFQCNRGNAYSEIQRRGTEIAALWPIHPSRIPNCNITRNPINPGDWKYIVVGQPGEIVYWVRNDDGTLTPIPAADMLHVPGIMSQNGITGLSLVRYAANAIGIGMATEEHAGAYFKNGASFSLALVSDKTVGEETANRLRQSWQQTYGGGANSYKTLILEEGMKPMPLSAEPEKSQLTLQRQFNVNEVARFWKVPPHMIGDLSNATFSNIEQQALEFVKYSLTPWIERWEKAMFRQLLTPDERKRYYFKFNLNALLRGDLATRTEAYWKMFQMGAYSTNDICDLEDRNPVEGGDQRFVPSNNLFPLDKATEMADAQIDKLKREAEPPPAPAQPSAPPSDQVLDQVRRELDLRDQVYERRIEKQTQDLKETIESSSEAQNRTLTDKIDEVRTKNAESNAETQNIAKEHAEAIGRTVVEAIATVSEKTSQQIAGVEERAVARQEAAEKKSEAEHDATVEMVVRQSKAITEAVTAAGDLATAQISETNAKLAEIPQKTVENLPKAPEAAPSSVVDTSAAEAVAVREAEVQRQSDELAARLAAERETTDRVLTLALARSIEKLAEWESKALDKAAEKPGEWLEWRSRFYQRFRRHFESDLKDFCPDSERCGVILDVEWGADRYAGVSINDLKTLDQFAADNYHDRVREGVDFFRKKSWPERSGTLAQEMVSRGRELFKQREGEKTCRA